MILKVFSAEGYLSVSVLLLSEQRLFMYEITIAKDNLHLK